MGMTVNAMAGMQAASETVSDYSVTAKAAETSEKKASAETEKDAVYEKSAQESAKAPYSINKMSKEDRAALVKQLKADQESRQNSLTNLVSQMLGKQAGMYGIANGDDSIWKIFANGNFTVDAATKAQAQEDISDDGYWGVKQTSQRLFDFASALAGDEMCIRDSPWRHRLCLWLLPLLFSESRLSSYRDFLPSSARIPSEIQFPVYMPRLPFRPPAWIACLLRDPRAGFPCRSHRCQSDPLRS